MSTKCQVCTTWQTWLSTSKEVLNTHKYEYQDNLSVIPIHVLTHFKTLNKGKADHIKNFIKAINNSHSYQDHHNKKCLGQETWAIKDLSGINKTWEINIQMTIVREKNIQISALITILYQRVISVY